MKQHGASFEYQHQRDADLMRVYRQALGESEHIRISDIFQRVVMMPAKRFWVSEERAAIVVSAMMRGESIAHMRPTKQRMFQEILSRVMMLRQQHPDWTIFNLTFEAVRQPAPCFYLTPGSAKVIVSKIKKRWRAKKN